MGILFTPKMRNLLIFGYSKEYINVDIPFVLNKLCLKYYDDVIDWNIKTKNLKNF